MRTQIVTEGRIKLEVPELKKFETSPNEYVPSLTPVFFNPLMELSRDIGISAVQVALRETGNSRICDPLAGVGARGLRYAKEIKGVREVIVNDASPEACKFIRRNIELNTLQNVEVHQEDARALLSASSSPFHVVDLDPFGTPAPFVGPACSSLARNGLLVVTATDTAPLCGSPPSSCMRKYGAQPLRTEYCHETGLRILIGFCQRVAAINDLALRPLLGYYAQHYFRVYLRAEKGKKHADNVLAKQGYLSHCRACGRRTVTEGRVPKLPSKCECGREFEYAGPLWIGELAERNFVENVITDLANRSFKLGYRGSKLLHACLDEIGGPPTFYDLNEIASCVKGSPPKLRKLIERIQKQGYFVSRTHFASTGLRTDAPYELLIEAFSSS